MPTAAALLLSAVIGPLPKRIVVPVKGQAALLKADLPPETPVRHRAGR